MSREPILPYATYNTVPDYIPPDDTAAAILEETEDGLVVVSEDSLGVELDDRETGEIWAR